VLDLVLPRKGVPEASPSGRDHRVDRLMARGLTGQEPGYFVALRPRDRIARSVVQPHTGFRNADGRCLVLSGNKVLKGRLGPVERESGKQAPRGERSPRVGAERTAYLSTWLEPDHGFPVDAYADPGGVGDLVQACGEASFCRVMQGCGSELGGQKC